MAGGLIVPPPLQTVRVIGGTLFQVALDTLGDAEQWSRIADLNGLIDPWISGYMVLNIPFPLPGKANLIGR